MSETTHGGFTVATVDDDPAIRRLITFYLGKQGYDTIECGSGEEAEEMLWGQYWDLAILDRRLPDMDGLELCRKIKAEERFRTRYVVVLTGKDEQEDKLEGFELGADDYVTKPFQPAELIARIRAARRIVELQKELVRTNERLEQLSITDGLTGVFNHRYFQEALAAEFEEAVRYDRPLSFTLIDLDYFKKVNDTYGHAAGDEVLKEISGRFQESIRGSDIVARYGGEEFAILMPQTDLEDARAFAEKIRGMVEARPVRTEEVEIPVTVSVGVASIPHSKLVTPLEMVDAADKALYRAKENGRNQVHWERREDPKRPARPRAESE